MVTWAEIEEQTDEQLATQYFDRAMEHTGLAAGLSLDLLAYRMLRNSSDAQQHVANQVLRLTQFIALLTVLNLVAVGVAIFV